MVHNDGEQTFERVTGYAPRRGELNAEQREANESSVSALVSLMGGLPGMKVMGIGFEQLSYVLEADPDDDLSGLRMIAERMSFGSQIGPRRIIDEDWVDPQTARRWLLGTNRAKETPDGEIELLDSEKDVHINLAGLAIATSMHGGRLSEAYIHISDSPARIQRDFLADMSWRINETYADPDEPAK